MRFLLIILILSLTACGHKTDLALPETQQTATR
ncbi:MAG: lipoprotein [Rickettsiales bacterium]|nr:lipoprotein [Rickettsiales bacterium]